MAITVTYSTDAFLPHRAKLKKRKKGADDSGAKCWQKNFLKKKMRAGTPHRSVGGRKSAGRQSGRPTSDEHRLGAWDDERGQGAAETKRGGLRPYINLY